MECAKASQFKCVRLWNKQSGLSPHYGNWDKLQHDSLLARMQTLPSLRIMINMRSRVKEKVLTDTLKLENPTHKHSDIETGRERWQTCSLKLQFLIDKNLHRRSKMATQMDNIINHGEADKSNEQPKRRHKAQMKKMRE